MITRAVNYGLVAPTSQLVSSKFDKDKLGEVQLKPHVNDKLQT